ncbi:hypothetical protein [Saliphagus infecundisoli]|uniref:Gfo/Idh/MocA-like oxidoreductase N-terminal domain-containing protein n=1 Tax=Saliphagus infecundisoli TaxID=1849069 RepID=A0ABD5QH55_9EURY|nr:hypothetical protein [Saliphagus infecundisoli]
MDELAVGVIGGGWMASDYHLPTYDEHPATRVVDREPVDGIALAPNRNRQFGSTDCRSSRIQPA